MEEGCEEGLEGNGGREVIVRRADVEREFRRGRVNVGNGVDAGGEAARRMDERWRRWRV